MDFVLDFRRTPGGEQAAALDATRTLLACFQTALGHELPNHLVVIQGFARLLQEEAAAQTDEGRAVLTRLADLARQVDETVRRLADLGRLCREVEGETPSSVPLEEVAREAIAEVNLMFSGQGIEYHVQEGLPILPVSRRPLHQVLVQLLRNAAQSAAANQERVRIEVGGTAQPGTEFWVRDNGRGLTGVSAGQLFEPFTGSGRGAGLGLFLVRSVVARWGGAIRLCSEAGAGTSVTITFPQVVEPGTD